MFVVWVTAGLYSNDACSQDLQDNERIRAQLNAGLNAMHSATDPVPPATASYPQPAAGIHSQPPYSAAGFGPGCVGPPGASVLRLGRVGA